MFIYTQTSYVQVLHGFGDVELVHGGDDDGRGGEEEEQEEEKAVDDKAAEPPVEATNRQMLPVENKVQLMIYITYYRTTISISNLTQILGLGKTLNIIVIISLRSFICTLSVDSHFPLPSVHSCSFSDEK